MRLLVFFGLCCVVTVTANAVLLEGARAPVSAVSNPATGSSADEKSMIQEPYNREEVKHAPHGSLAGTADPGYGPASATRTDLQRAHEAAVDERRKMVAKAALERKPIPMNNPLEPLTKADARNLERHIYRRVNEMAGFENAVEIEQARSKENVAGIQTKAAQITNKLSEATKEVQMDVERMDAAEDSAHADKVPKHEGPLSKAQQKKRAMQIALKSEEAKLKAADEAKLRDKSTAPEEPIAVHRSGNWADKERYPDFARFVPKGDRKDNASWREKGDTSAAQRRP